jgi:Spy/CpxP family protein refolding chaperone
MGRRSGHRIPLFLGLAAIVLFSFSVYEEARGMDPADFGWSAFRGQPRSSGRPLRFGLTEGRLLVGNAEALELTDETVAAIKKALKEQEALEAEAVEEQVAAYRALNALLDEGLPSEEDLLKAGRGTADATTKIRDLRMGFSLKVRGLLTPEQLESYMLRRESLEASSARRR